MTKEERLKLMVKGLPKGYSPRHCQLAAEVLDKLATELSKQGYKFKEDPQWPYHLLVPTQDSRYISFFCGGFRKDIYIQQLTKDGIADTRFAEVTYSTPKGAINYLRRKKC